MKGMIFYNGEHALEAANWIKGKLKYNKQPKPAGDVINTITIHANIN